MQRATALLARGLALLWAGFWLFFFVVESLAWHTSVGVMAEWVGAGLFFVLVATVAWHREFAGGLLLVAVGVLAGSAYAMRPPAGLPAGSRVMTTVVFGVPPILAGILFLFHHRAASAVSRGRRDRPVVGS
jgi:hypothetical protein